MLYPFKVEMIAYVTTFVLMLLSNGFLLAHIYKRRETRIMVVLALMCVIIAIMLMLLFAAYIYLIIGLSSE